MIKRSISRIHLMVERLIDNELFYGTIHINFTTKHKPDLAVRTVLYTTFPVSILFNI